MTNREKEIYLKYANQFIKTASSLKKLEAFDDRHGPTAWLNSAQKWVDNNTKKRGWFGKGLNFIVNDLGIDTIRAGWRAAKGMPRTGLGIYDALRGKLSWKDVGKYMFDSALAGGETALNILPGSLALKAGGKAAVKVGLKAAKPTLSRATNKGLNQAIEATGKALRPAPASLSGTLGRTLGDGTKGLGGWLIGKGGSGFLGYRHLQRAYRKQKILNKLNASKWEKTKNWGEAIYHGSLSPFSLIGQGVAQSYLGSAAPLPSKTDVDILQSLDYISPKLRNKLFTQDKDGGLIFNPDGVNKLTELLNNEQGLFPREITEDDLMAAYLPNSINYNATGPGLTGWLATLSSQKNSTQRRQEAKETREKIRNALSWYR